MPALSGQKCPHRGVNHASGHFFTCRLVLELFARPHNDPVIRIGSKLILGLKLCKFGKKVIAIARFDDYYK
jgi:hypothetical protein